MKKKWENILILVWFCIFVLLLIYKKYSISALWFPFACLLGQDYSDKKKIANNILSFVTLFITISIFALPDFWKPIMYGLLNFAKKIFNSIPLYIWITVGILVILYVNQVEEAKKREKRRKRLIDEYGEYFAKLILNKTLERGMSFDIVKEILGKPHHKEYKIKGNADIEIWKYNEYKKGCYMKILKFKDGELFEYSIK